MLCPKCEAIRFPPTQATSCSDAVGVDNSHGKKAPTTAHRVTKQASKQPITTVSTSSSASDENPACSDHNEAELETMKRRAVDAAGSKSSTPTNHGQIRVAARNSEGKATAADRSRQAEVAAKQLSTLAKSSPMQPHISGQAGTLSATLAGGESKGMMRKQQHMSPKIVDDAEIKIQDDEPAESVILRRRVDELAATVTQQGVIIMELQRRLNAVFEYLEVPVGGLPHGSLKSDLSQLKACSEVTLSLQPESQVRLPTASYAETAGRAVGLPSDDHSTKVVLAAVHSEVQQVQRRKHNVVISGLKPVEGVSDADLFSQICEDCLPVKPAIHHFRRLGKLQPGKVRRLLVALRN